MCPIWMKTALKMYALEINLTRIAYFIIQPYAGHGIDLCITIVKANE